jgi:triosephosphate isomerase
MRKRLLAGNWKMHKTVRESIELTSCLKRELFEVQGLDIVICPPFTALSDVSEIVLESNIQLGAQNMYWEKEGAFTGEISGVMLKELGCRFVILGHSERRGYFAETNDLVNKKIRAALESELIPIVCVGESLQEREKNLTLQILTDQIKNGLRGLTKEEIARIVVAYEPVWAIGTGRTASSQQAQEAQSHIRQLLVEDFGQEVAEEIRILYGGSVKPDNISELIAQRDIDGALVGGASLDCKSFVEIVKKCTLS